jgi:outer membrane protein OmpA-like peptidoglycan-associated protein
MNKLYPYIIILALSLCSSFLFGQTAKDIMRIKKIAENHFSEENYIAAYPLLKNLELVSNEKSNIRYMLAICEMEYKKNYAASINLFEAIKINHNKGEYQKELHNLLGDSYHYEYQFDNAIKSYEAYKVLIKNDENLIANIDRKIEISQNAKLLYSEPKDYELKNLWVRVNSSWKDYAPVISADETSLIFTSKKGGGINPEPDLNGEYYSDLYISHKNSANEWGYAKFIKRKVNSKYDDFSSCLTSDGQKLFFYRSSKNNKEGVMFQTYLNGSSWDEPIKFGPGINGIKFSKSLSISSDEQTIYFISEDESGVGRKDIYISKKTDEGTWGDAKNLGIDVNTIYDEESPFIHPDGKTLFFSSKGHNTMGGFDVFKTVFDGAKWSTPENLGYPLNSTKDDLHFVLSANGKNGYYSSVRKDGYGKEDIYIVGMPNINIPLTMIRGKILCKESLKPLDVRIKVKDVETGQFIRHIYRPNPETGKYLIILPPGKNYDMIISTAGYAPYKMNVFIPNQTKFYELYQTIYLKAIELYGEKIAQGISVDNSFFKENGIITDLNEEYKREQKRQLELQNLLNKIINASDSLSLNNMNEVVASNFEETHNTLNIDTSFNTLLAFIDQVFENTDSIALKHVNNIIERGFYTYAEENVYSLNVSNPQDTLMITKNDFKQNKSINNTDSLDFGIVKSDMIKSRKHFKRDELFALGLKDSKYLKVVLFDYEMVEVKSSYHQKINDLVQLYKHSLNNELVITGHTDNIGSESYNQELSKRRVEAVQNFLIKKGIPLNKIKVKWKGEMSPVKSNNSKKQRAKNRRVEIILIENID